MELLRFFIGEIAARAAAELIVFYYLASPNSPARNWDESLLKIRAAIRSYKALLNRLKLISATFGRAKK